MKYEIKLQIDLPRADVIEKLDNVDNMKHWQRGLVSAEHISGTPGETGAQMKLSYQMGKRSFYLIETITKRNFPEEFHATYETKGVKSTQENYFSETREGNTIWTSVSKFKPSGIMMKVMAFLMPKAFKKQSMQYLEDFKNFAENGVSVSKN